MKTHNLTQGTPAWNAYRTTMFNASDAPAMMGESPYKTRTQLMHEQYSGITPDVDAATQARFDDGHRFEALARPLAEEIIGMELYPVVGSEGKLSASFDGLTMCETTAFEHKTLNESLRACMRDEGNGYSLPLQYQIQMEQQLMVSGAERCLFMASKWDGSELVEERHCWYASDSKLRASILQGWTQFAIDLENYTPTEAVAAPVGRTPETLPALHIEVTGMVTASNLAEFKQIALGAIRSVNRDLKTDQDFADSSKARKWCADIESKAKAAKQHALGQTATIDELFRALDEISNEARDTRIELERIEKARNATLKTDIVTAGQMALGHHLVACNDRIGRPLMPSISADFAGVIKGKSKFDNMRDAVATELARAKISANEWADRIILNLRTINEQEGFGHLFFDQAQLALKDPEFVAMAIKNRIADYQVKEAEKLEAQRLQIEATERAKAQATERARADAEISAATAKAQAEAQAQIDAEAKRASDEAIAKAKAEQNQPAATMQQAQAAIEKIAHQAPVCEIAHTENAPVGSPLSPPTLRLGQICERLSPIQITADGLRQLGFEPAATDKAAKLYHENDFPRMCAVLVRHINSVCQLQAA